MNRKHKNKNKHKSPNPVPPQKITTEIVTETKPNELEIKEDLPEIVSESAIPPQLTETQSDLPTDTPKIPKRQRGPKKRERDQVRECGEKNPEPCKETFVLVEETKEKEIEINNDIKNYQEIQPIELLTRKKKNKNKKCTNTPEIKEKEPEVVPIETETVKEIKPDEKCTIYLEETEDKKEEIILLPNEGLDQQCKQSKKKNKKGKKATDSQKSDTYRDKSLEKNIETVEQNLLVTEIKSPEQLANIEHIHSTTNVSIKTDDILMDLELNMDDHVIPIENLMVLTESDSKEPLVEKDIIVDDYENEKIDKSNVSEWKFDSGKHKKKNKKDKKHASDKSATTVSDSTSKSAETETVLISSSVECIDDNISLHHETKSSLSKDVELKGKLQSEENSANVEKIVNPVTDIQAVVAKQDIESKILNARCSDTLSSTISVKKENLSICETNIPSKTPDIIEYQRSASEQATKDTNNNTVIREITSNQPITQKLTIVPEVPHELSMLEIPVSTPDTPLVDCTIKSAIIEPDVLNSGIQITEEIQPVKDKTTEKTDLKSKVLEVNNDMEELRLSIEKSLAELTALEKSQELPELVLIPETPNPSCDADILSVTGVESKVSEETDFKQEIEVIQKKSPSIKDKEEQQKRKESKGKGKSKKKGNNQTIQVSESGNSQSCITSQSETSDQKSKTDTEQTTDKKETTTQDDQKKDKVSESEIVTDFVVDDDSNTEENKYSLCDDYDHINQFEDAMTSSIDDVNRSFELIVNEAVEESQNIPSALTVDETDNFINATTSEKEFESSEEEKKDDKQNRAVPHPKNLLGHSDIPVTSTKTDYKKERNKTPNAKQAKVKIKDSVNPEQGEKPSKQSQTENKQRVTINKKLDNSTVCNYLNEEEDYIYKYSFRKVFLSSACHVCKKELNEARIPCNFCNLIFYCTQKHKDEDWNYHQEFCFAVSTIIHLKGLEHIYADTKDVSGQNYRLLRMQVIVSCEKILKRKLLPWEQEALLYPRMCSDISCRDWRQTILKDCDGCGQVAGCKDKSEHFPKNHQRWCKSYYLYQKLVGYQQTKGRLEPKLPTRIITNMKFQLPDKINELLATVYEEKIDIDDMQYAALTQLATAPLTTAYSYQLYDNNMNRTFANGVHKKSTFTVHVVGAELQFEADALNKWEIFFLHLRPDVKELNIVLVGPDLNPSNLPLDLLAKIKLCEICRQNKRRVLFSFYDKQYYCEFHNGDDFTLPDIVCAFNPGLHRAYSAVKSWSATVDSIFKTRAPFCVTSYTPNELARDLAKIKELSQVEHRIVAQPSSNPYASIRPDRNFISDEEMPLIFKNYHYMILCGTF